MISHRFTTVMDINDYVLRISHWWEGLPADVSLESITDPFPGINVGQAVAKIGNVFLLKKQSGIPAGVPHGPIRSSTNADKIYEEHLERTANMPPSAYDKLVATIKTIEDAGYQFDPSKANNILVDTENQTFNVVDIGQRDIRSNYRTTVAGIVSPLMDNGYAWRYKGNNPKVIEWRRIILEKSIEAGHTLPPVFENDSTFLYSLKIAGLESKDVGNIAKRFHSDSVGKIVDTSTPLKESTDPAVLGTETNIKDHPADKNKSQVDQAVLGKQPIDLTKGGIDVRKTEDILKTNGEGVKFDLPARNPIQGQWPLSPEDLQNLPGLTPVIFQMNVIPIQQLPAMFLGVTQEDKAEDLSLLEGSL